jgi:hypothetical protein
VGSSRSSVSGRAVEPAAAGGGRPGDRVVRPLRLRRPQGRVVDVGVFVNGSRTKHAAGENITRLTISKLPNHGRSKVKIIATSANGVKLVSKRTYRVCTKSKPKGKRVHPKR